MFLVQVPLNQCVFYMKSLQNGYSVTGYGVSNSHTEGGISQSNAISICSTISTGNKLIFYPVRHISPSYIAYLVLSKGLQVHDYNTTVGV